MGFLIGAPSASGWSLSTWGKLRRAVGQRQYNLPIGIIYKIQPDVLEDFNTEYHVDLLTGNFFKSNATPYGLLKGGFVLTPPTDVPDMFNLVIPFVDLYDVQNGTMDVTLQNFDNDSYVGQLTGETVVFTPFPPPPPGTDQFVITGAMATAPPVNVPGYPGEPLVSVGKLTPIS
jgi:hypothetical protein